MRTPYDDVDGTLILSAFHEESIRKNDGYAGPFMRAANGINPNEFRNLDWSKRDPHKALYASAPNRGLDFLLAAWPAIREAVPDATLDVFYGWEITRKMMSAHPALKAELGPLLEHIEAQLESLKDSGVVYHGGVDHATLHQAYVNSSLWLFPTQFPEISCISAMKSMACGTWPIVFKTGALPETLGDWGHQLDPVTSVEDYADNVILWMRIPPSQGERRAMSNFALKERSWDKAAEQFLAHARGKKLKVALYAQASIPFDGNSLSDPRGRNVGGSEEGVIVLAKALAGRGVDVTVYHNQFAADTKTDKFIDGVRYSGQNEVKENPTGTLISLRDPKLTKTLKEKYPNQPVISWLMDPHYLAASPKDILSGDRTVVLTNAHRNILKRHHDLPATEVIPIALDESELPPLSVQNDIGRHPEWVMWASSPDRGLVHLLRMWPNVLREVPNAQLHIFYGIETCLWRAEIDKSYKQAADILECKQLIDKLPSVIYHGSMPRAEFIAQHVRCGTLAYTCDGFEETQCLTAIRAQACGIWPVYTDLGSLSEVITGDAVTLWTGFECKLIEAIKNPVSFQRRLELANKIRERFSVQRMADSWIKLLEQF